MICLTCGHYSNPDGEMEREQRSGACACPCHPWNHPAARRPLTCAHDVLITERCDDCYRASGPFADWQRDRPLASRRRSS